VGHLEPARRHDRAPGLPTSDWITEGTKGKGYQDFKVGRISITPIKVPGHMNAKVTFSNKK
jgi:hypothetical protein